MVTHYVKVSRPRVGAKIPVDDVRYMGRTFEPGQAFETSDRSIYQVRKDGSMVRLNKPKGTKKQRRAANRRRREMLHAQTASTQEPQPGGDPGTGEPEAVVRGDGAAGQGDALPGLRVDL